MALSEPETGQLGWLSGQQAPVWAWPIPAAPHSQSSAYTAMPAVWWALDLNSDPPAFTAGSPCRHPQPFTRYF